MQIEGPPVMKLDPEYYFMNVLVRNQLIDYDHSRLRRNRLPLSDGTCVTSTHFPPGGRGVVFKPHATYHIWHELSFWRDDEHFLFSSMDVLVSDQLWHELNSTFPDEIDPDELSADELIFPGAAH